MFIGDSRARHVFDMLTNFLDPTHDDKFHKIGVTCMHDQYVHIPELKAIIVRKVYRQKVYSLNICM